MKTRYFLIVFMFLGPEGQVYHNCWMSLTGDFNRKAIMRAATQAGLDANNVTVVCIQELDS